MQRYKNVHASFYSEFFTSRYPYVQCKYHIVWTIDIYSFRRTPRYCTWYLYHFRTLNKWNWQKNMDHLIRYISEKIAILSLLIVSPSTCTILLIYSTHIACFLNLLVHGKHVSYPPSHAPPLPLFAYLKFSYPLQLHLPFTEDSALLPGSGKNLGPVDPIIISNEQWLM